MKKGVKILTVSTGGERPSFSAGFEGVSGDGFRVDLERSKAYDWFPLGNKKVRSS